MLMITGANQKDRAIITDVTLREYGQNVPADSLTLFTPEIRVEIAMGLVEAGFESIEVLSCVHPGIAPAMNPEHMKRIAAGLGRMDGIHLITLVPNKAGYRHFLSLGLGPDGYNHTMGTFFSAIEEHNLANLGRPVKESIEEYKAILRDARSRDIRVVAYISAAFGYMDPAGSEIIRPNAEDIHEYVEMLFDLGAATVTLSDLQGVADEEETVKTFEMLLGRIKAGDMDRIGYHPHHLSGHKAIMNSKRVYTLGIRRYDASMGGTGGCVTGAPGNQPTELLVRAFHQSGIETGLDEHKVLSLSQMINKKLFERIPLDRKGHQ